MGPARAFEEREKLKKQRNRFKIFKIPQRHQKLRKNLPNRCLKGVGGIVKLKVLLPYQRHVLPIGPGPGPLLWSLLVAPTVI